MLSRGFVSLVGAGPGDPELLTLKGLRRLQAAEVVLYDALVGAELLQECRPDAELVYVGKRAGEHHRSQEWINALLVQRALAGLQVVRLKGGDPFLFGRGGEEAEALQAAGISWEVVPGVTSAIAAPAYAGIPVTHRSRASSVAFITGHEAADRSRSLTDWRALAEGVDTLVVLMGLGRLAAIAAELVAHGRDPDTPVAAIRWGTTSSQAAVVGTLATIAGDVAGAGLTSPALIVIGEVVGMHEQLAWFEPLAELAVEWGA